jgi:hypothetical protein
VHRRQTPATQRTALIIQRREELPLKTMLRRRASAVRRPFQRLFRRVRPRGHRPRSLFSIAPKSGHQSAAATTPVERPLPVLEDASKLRRALQRTLGLVSSVRASPSDELPIELRSEDRHSLSSSPAELFQEPWKTQRKFQNPKILSVSLNHRRSRQAHPSRLRRASLDPKAYFRFLKTQLRA